MLSFLILFILLLLLPDFYIWMAFVRGNVPLYLSLAYWIPSALALAALIAATAWQYHDWLMKLFFGVLLCIAVPKLLFTLLSLTGRAVGVLVPQAVTAGNAVGITVAIVCCVAFAYGFLKGWKRLETKELTFSSSALPGSFDGYRIVHISDLHLGTYGDRGRFISRLITRIDSLHPDLIVFTGDLVNTSASELDPYMGLLPRLKATDGVFSILGNHDYCEYNRYDSADGASRNLAEVIRRERGFGWQLLLNEHRLIRRGEDAIAVIGVENDSRPPFPAKGDLKKAMQGIPDGLFTILLSHDPTHWRREVLSATDVHLTLSGHTHAMQLKVGGFSPSSWSYPEWGGLYREGERALYVSLGVGGTVPFRFGAWPEITLITLKRDPS